MKKSELKNKVKRLEKERAEMMQDMKNIIFNDCISTKMKWGMIISMNEQAERVVFSGHIVENKNFEAFSRFFNDDNL